MEKHVTGLSLTDAIPGRKGEILDAAVSVFAERGYDAGSVREIAERVGISEPAIYRHFASKEDLFLSLVDAVGVRVETQIGPLLDATQPQDVERVLHLVFSNRAAAARAYLPLLRTVLGPALHNPTFRSAYREKVTGRMYPYLERLVPKVDAYYGLSPNPADLDLRIRTLISVFIGYFITAFVFEDKPLPIPEAMMRVMDWKRE